MRMLCNPNPVVLPGVEALAIVADGDLDAGVLTDGTLAGNDLRRAGKGD
jgi:hypothetical protein